VGIDFVKLSKITSHALRHEPWLYELEIDSEGWTSISALMDSIRLQDSNWQDLSVNDVMTMVSSSDKRRYEVVDGRIRALYGHSLSQKLEKLQAIPPEVLFHGTSPEVFQIIQIEGLKPMQRQYVHLSTNQEMADQVGRRKVKSPIVLMVNSKMAHNCGVKFYQGNEVVWLCDYVPPKFIS
jgi:putative RNA 2'-phosphotransferase